VPRLLSSKPHVLLLLGLGVYLTVAAAGSVKGQPPFGDPTDA
jgi:hypothetical protein